MNKLTVIIGAAAVAAFSGCKDTSYKYADNGAQNEAKTIEAEPSAAPAVAQPIATAEKKCLCPPGAKHATPIAPVEPAFSEYIVQPGDYLAKISKKFNVTINSIKRLNPSIKKDIVRVGTKIKIPGKHEIVQKPLASTAAKKPAAKKAVYTAYSGATKEYVVKAGDTVGGIAYGNGCNIRQLKELNGLKSNNLRIGQKLKVPANGKAAAPKAAPSAPAVKAAPAAAPVVAPAAPEAAPAEVKAPEAAPAAPEAAPAAPAAPEAAPAATAPAAPAPTAAPATFVYKVEDGEDITAVSIRFGVSAATICELNNLAPDAQLKVGQLLRLPADAQQ